MPAGTAHVQPKDSRGRRGTTLRRYAADRMGCRESRHPGPGTPIIRPMLRRVLNIAALLWATWWFVYFAPMHQRGAVQVAGPDPAAAPAKAEHSCCATDRPASSPPQEAPERNPSSRCAVCYLVAGLDIPPTLVLDVPELGLLRLLPTPPLTDQVASVDRLLLRHGRAPPAFFA